VKRSKAYLVHAEIKSAEARAKLTGTLSTLQRRLNPHALATETVDRLKERAITILDEGVTAAKARPGTTAAIVALILAYLFRGPILRLVMSFFETDDATGTTSGELRRKAARRDKEPGQ
jgi:hypothetical protein